MADNPSWLCAEMYVTGEVHFAAVMTALPGSLSNQ